MISLQNVLIGYLCLWATAPPLAYGGEYRALALLAAGGWFALECIREGSIIRRPTLPALLALIYISYVAVVEFLYQGAGGVIRNIQVFIALLFLVIQQSRRHNIESLLPVFWLVLLTMPVWYVITLDVLWSENSHAARILVRSGAEAERLSARGVGGYSLVYGTLLVLPVLVGLAKRLNHVGVDGMPAVLRSFPMMPAIVIWSNVILGSLVILNAGFSIAVLSMIVCVAAVFAVPSYSPFRILCLVLAGCFLALFWTDILSGVLEFLLPISEGTNFHLKIRDTLASIRLEESVGTVALRAERYQRSLELFLMNPLFGTLFFADIGKHSQILDEFAQYGVFIGAVFVYLSLVVFVSAMRRQNRTFGIAFGTFCAVLLLYFLNNTFSGAGVSMYIVFPVGFALLEQPTRRSSYSMVSSNA